MRIDVRAALAVALALAACGRPAANAPAANAATNAARAAAPLPTPPPERATADLFALASPDAWTPIRNSGGGVQATARLTAAGDAALVTWQGAGQIWCGTATPEQECAGGRFFLLVVRPEALPGAAALGRRPASIALAVNGRAVLNADARNLGPGVVIRGDVTASPRELLGYQALANYGGRPDLRRELARCRKIEVTLLDRSFDFACDRLPADV